MAAVGTAPSRRELSLPLALGGCPQVAFGAERGCLGTSNAA